MILQDPLLCQGVASLDDIWIVEIQKHLPAGSCHIYRASSKSIKSFFISCAFIRINICAATARAAAILLGKHFKQKVCFAPTLCNSCRPDTGIVQEGIIFFDIYRFYFREINLFSFFSAGRLILLEFGEPLRVVVYWSVCVRAIFREGRIPENAP